MHDTLLSPGWDTILVAVPFIGLLIAGFFRLDEFFTAPKERPRYQRHACGVDEDGRPILCDPDGRRWIPARHHR